MTTKIFVSFRILVKQFRFEETDTCIIDKCIPTRLICYNCVTWFEKKCPLLILVSFSNNTQLQTHSWDNFARSRLPWKKFSKINSFRKICTVFPFDVVGAIIFWFNTFVCLIHAEITSFQYVDMIDRSYWFSFRFELNKFAGK